MYGCVYVYINIQTLSGVYQFLFLNVKATETRFAASHCINSTIYVKVMQRHCPLQEGVTSQPPEVL